MGIERVLSLDIAGSQDDPLGRSVSAEAKREIRRFLEEHADRVSGLIPIDPDSPVESCQKMEEWIGDGPCVGIKYYGGNPQGVTCSHSNNDPIIELAAKLQAIIYIHTWLVVGGVPRRPGGGANPGESTPMDVALLAERFPKVPLICGHSGGDWELGVRRCGRTPTSSSNSPARIRTPVRSTTPWPKWVPTDWSGAGTARAAHTRPSCRRC